MLNRGNRNNLYYYYYYYYYSYYYFFPRVICTPGLSLSRRIPQHVFSPLCGRPSGGGVRGGGDFSGETPLMGTGMPAFGVVCSPASASPRSPGGSLRGFGPRSLPVQFQRGSPFKIIKSLSLSPRTRGGEGTAPTQRPAGSAPRSAPWARGHRGGERLQKGEDEEAAEGGSGRSSSPSSLQAHRGTVPRPVPTLGKKPRCKNTQCMGRKKSQGAPLRHPILPARGWAPAKCWHAANRAVVRSFFPLSKSVPPLPSTPGPREGAVMLEGGVDAAMSGGAHPWISFALPHPIDFRLDKAIFFFGQLRQVLRVEDAGEVAASPCPQPGLAVPGELRTGPGSVSRGLPREFWGGQSSGDPRRVPGSFASEPAGRESPAVRLHFPSAAGFSLLRRQPKLK